MNLWYIVFCCKYPAHVMSRYCQLKHYGRWGCHYTHTSQCSFVVCEQRPRLLMCVLWFTFSLWTIYHRTEWLLKMCHVLSIVLFGFSSWFAAWKLELCKAQTGFRPLFHHTRSELVVDMLKSVIDWHTYNSWLTFIYLNLT